MWCHLPTIFKRRHVLRTAALIALCVGITTTLFFAAPSHAAPGVNQVIGFQGRLLSASGGVVPDGTYNIQFKIYQDGTGQAASDPDGSLKWTETYTSGTGGGISVKNGYFSVDLGSRNAFGSSVDWNQDTLWLSMNIAGSSTCTTFGSDCTADGEMLPMKRIDSVPYAMNAGTVGGKSASDLIQNGTSQQTADFNISGTGTATTLQGNTSVITPLLDTQSTGDVLSIGTTKAGGVTIGKTNGTNTIYGGTTMNGPLTLGGTSTTNFAMSVSQTLNSAFTTSIEGIQNQLNINPQGATLSNLYGMVNLPVISGGSAAIANAYGMYTRLDTTSGFTGTIDTGNGLMVGGPNLGSAGDANGIKIGTYSGINIQGASQNGGNTSGTITNYGIQLQGNTATAGVGGTVNNVGISLIMPSGGAAGGTTKNIGLNLSGNGNANATNWAIYSSSTASSYLQGNVLIGGATNPDSNALNVGGGAGITLGAGDAFKVKDDSGTSLLSVDNDTNSVTVGSGATFTAKDLASFENGVTVQGGVTADTLDTASAGTLSIGTTNATAVTVGNVATSITNSIYGSTILKSAADGNSAVVFQLQQADGTPMFSADSVAQTITIGNALSGDKMVISTANGQVTYYGSARRTRKISLSAEYTGSVLDSGTGSNNTGTMTSSVDLTNRMNYYRWTTNQSSNQSYDVVVQVPLPTDFDGWANSNPLAISTYTSDTTNGTITLEARDSSNVVQCNFVSVTPASTGTWSTNSTACTLSSGTYTAGNYITFRIRMQSPNGGDVRLGNINLSYLSKY